MKICTYHSSYASAFKALNIEWLETYFYVEPYDDKVLSNPEKFIINKGGHIFFAVDQNRVFGTVALMPIEGKSIYELTKMAVLPETRGKGIGNKLLEYCINFVKSQQHPSLLLYSHRSLESAIHLYKKCGFKEIPVEKNSHYKRADIKMELTFY